MFFFFKDTATTEIYTYGHTLSLHDALPISRAGAPSPRRPVRRHPGRALAEVDAAVRAARAARTGRTVARCAAAAGAAGAGPDLRQEIGRASCRERVCQYV